MSQVRKFLEEILTIEKAYEDLIGELCGAMTMVFGDSCFLSPAYGIKRLRDAALKSTSNGGRWCPGWSNGRRCCWPGFERSCGETPCKPTQDRTGTE